MSATARTVVPATDSDPVLALDREALREVRTVFRDGTPEQVARLLDAMPELPFHPIDAGGSRRHHVLEIAAATGEYAKVEHVLSRNPDAARGRDDVLTALLQGGRHDQTSDPVAVELLVAHGAVFPSEAKAACRFVRDGLRRCLREDDLPLLEHLMRLGFDPLETARAAGANLVIEAIEIVDVRGREGAARIAERLMELGGELHEGNVDETGRHRSRNVLVAALRSGLHDTARWILDRTGAATVSSPMLLQVAAEHPELPLDLRERLLADLTALDAPFRGYPPLHSATLHANTGFIDDLLARGASLESLDEDGHTPLLAAVVARQKDAVVHLVAAGADVNAADADGRTVLDHARGHTGFKRVCTRLEKAGAKLGIELAPAGGGTLAAMDRLRGDIDDDEPWAEALLARLSTADDAHVAHWYALTRHCLDNNASRPSARWSKQATPLLAAIGDDVFREAMLDVLPRLAEPRREPSVERDEWDDWGGWFEPSAFGEGNARLLKGLLWLCGRHTDSEVCTTLRQVAVIGYRKVYGIGMRNARIANAAAVALAGMPGDSGVKELSILRATTRYNPAKVNIDRVFDKLAAERGLTPDELAEVSTPDYGLSDVGHWEGTVGEFAAELTLTGVGKSTLAWRRGEKTQKSVPAAVKAEHADELEALKRRIKEIDTATRAHCRRIEQSYLSGRRHRRDEWRERLVDHRLIGHYARKLVWQIEDGRRRFSVMHDGTALVGVDGKEASMTDAATVSLWHPSLAPIDEVVHWRRWIVERGITQPFKQAHREVYVLTDAERATGDHSLRFADHILDHSQFHALATERGWQQRRGGQWDGGHENAAHRVLPAHRLCVELDAEGAERYGATHGGIYRCVGTGAVRFYRDRRPVELASIDPLVFSELMRDVDLFVGVSGIANDPEWQARDVADHGGYWRDNAFGELGEQARTRRTVLETLIPQLRIGERLRLEERFLVVEGERRTYRIHLGSSNILMEPNDQYLCIVAARGATSIMLPFEGDRTLSLILSKALLLADDAKIKDPTILSQIGTGV